MPLSVHHVNLTVTDPERSAAWYRDVLGLEFGWEVPDAEGHGRKVVLLAPDSTLRIVLTKHAANDGRPFSEYTTGLDHIAFAVVCRDELETHVERLDKLGVDHSAVKEGATGWLVTLRDPDNIQLELYTRTK